MPMQPIGQAVQGMASIKMPSIAQKTKTSPLPSLPKIEMPKMPEPPKVPNLMGQMSGGLKGLGNFMSNPMGALPDKATMAGFATQKTPPLSMYTHHLGGLQGTANSALGWLQNRVQNNPQGFGQLASTFGAPLTRTVLGVPGLGMPGMLGLYGMLSGGKPMEDVYRLFSPLMGGN